MSRSNRTLSVIAAALLLIVLIVPTASSKLEELWLSANRFDAASADPVCIPASYCFRVIGSRFERVGHERQIPLHLEGADNIYDLARELDAGRLKVLGDTAAGSVSLHPKYDLYFNGDEAARRVEAALRFDRPPAGRIAVAFEHRGGTSAPLVLDIRRSELGTLEAALAQAETKHIRLALTLLVMLLALVTGAWEARASDRMRSGACAIVLVILARLVVLHAARTVASPLTYMLVVAAILMPWLALLAQLPWVRRTGEAPATAAPPAPRGRTSYPLSLLEVGALAVILGLFAHMLWFDASFRWSIFEERDFLVARLVAATGTFPLYGPELLLGGQTVGSGLYLLLAPIVALWNDPQALLLLNRLLFIAMGVVLWWGLRDWVGPAGALFAVFALAASERVVALSYWPIHPNFSLFFAVVYSCAVIRGAVDAHRGWLIFSGLLLGVLTQLHFSYFLLLPAHVLLVGFGNGPRDRWTRPLAAAAVLLPLAPFLIIDALQGFPNITQISERPRFHAHYPNAPLGNIRLLSVGLAWPQQIGGPYANVFSQLTVLLIGIGIALGLGSAMAMRTPARARMTPAFAATLLLCVPLFELNAQGLGYNSRHTLSMMPALFILAAVGFAAVMHLLRATRPWVGVALMLPLIGVLGLRAADSRTIATVVRSEGEWAVDYRSREAIAMDLAVRLGLSPAMYPQRAIWWWLGWSIDPAIYAEIHRRVAPATGSGPVMSPDRFVLVTRAAELPPYLAAAFYVTDVRPVAGMYVHAATPKPKVAAVPPSSNADTGVRLHAFLHDVDHVRRREEGFVRIGHQHLATGRRDLFLATMAQGRIKLVVTIEQSQVGDRGRLRWCVDSPSLNGHYQEIKTVWRPRLVLTPGSGSVMTSELALDVLGGLLYKTPRCGEAWSPRAGAWQVSLMADGVFDASFMKRPELTQTQWPLDFTAPLRTDVLRQAPIAAWLGSRLGE